MSRSKNENSDDECYTTTQRQRYYKRYYYTLANFKAREEAAKRNLMKLEIRAKNFFKGDRNDEQLTNLKCRNCYLSVSYDDLIDHALECYGVDRLTQFKKKVYHCPLCVYATHSRLYMIEHVVISHCNKSKPVMYHCKPCNMGFARKARFELHKVYRHQHKFEYYCFICNKSYYRGIHFKEHMDLHYGRRYKCELCGKNTTSQQNLKFHMMALHWYENKNFTCLECGKKFALKKQLREHERVHTGYEPARCKICNKTFALFSNLNAHYNKHIQVARFKCTNCSRSFSYLSNLIRHRRIKHSHQIGKYVCNYCGKWYIDKRDYEDHITVHNQRPNQKFDHCCELCNTTFRIKKYLKRHIRTHVTQYECLPCNKTYKQNTSLNRHIRIKHFEHDNIT